MVKAVRVVVTGHARRASYSIALIGGASTENGKQGCANEEATRRDEEADDLAALGDLLVHEDAEQSRQQQRSLQSDVPSHTYHEHATLHVTEA